MAYLLSVGRSSPWSVRPVQRSGAAFLVLDGAVPIFVISISKPTLNETTAIRDGYVDIAVHQARSSGFIIIKFTHNTDDSLYFDTSFHVGIELPRRHCFDKSMERDGRELLMVIVLQDDY